MIIKHTIVIFNSLRFNPYLYNTLLAISPNAFHNKPSMSLRVRTFIRCHPRTNMIDSYLNSVETVVTSNALSLNYIQILSTDDL